MESMTGFAQLKFSGGVIIAKSVNGKFLDVNIYSSIPGITPQDVHELNKTLKAEVARTFNRGTVEITIKTDGASDIKTIIRNYKSLIDLLDEELQHPDPAILSLVIKESGILKTDNLYKDNLDPKEKDPLSTTPTTPSALKPIIDAFIEVLARLKEDRVREGEFLKSDLLKKLAQLEKIVYNIDEWQPKMESLFRETLENKFKELISYNAATYPLGTSVGAGVENLITAEVAVMLVRYTINEEVTRLHSHIAGLSALMEAAGPVGKKLEFLSQEILRELNTIASKSQFGELSHLIVLGKDTLEAIREQARNVE